MLERATACLKSGAARESLRCASKAAPRSKRLLHSTFWNHGAGDLDLPPWALSMLPMPTDLPLRGDDKSSVQIGREQQTGYVGHGMADGVFLDFLYPQQALALLHRRSMQQGQRWEKRNVKRLPDGFVVASRGYASRTKTAKARRAAKELRSQEEAEDGVDDAFTKAEKGSSKVDEQSQGLESAERAAQDAEPDYSAMGFGHSPLDLAEQSYEAARALRNLMSFNKRRIENRTKARDLVEQAWKTFQTLDDAGQEDGRLKTEFLSWLNTQATEEADAHCAELYHSLPLGQRTMRVYEIALSLFIRKDQQLSASKLHREALQNLENGYQISRTLFRYAIDNDLWRLAIRTESRHRNFYGDSSQMQLFWLHASEIPGLLDKALKLVDSVKSAGMKDQIDDETKQFCITFIKEAATQEFLRADAEQYTLSGTRRPPADRIRKLFRTLDTLAGSERDVTEFCEEILMELISPTARLPYSSMHGLVTSIYDMYKGKDNVNPSEQLLGTLLDRVTHYTSRRRTMKRTSRNITIASLVDDWVKFHGRVSVKAHARLVSYYARNGQIDDFERALQSFKAEHPDPTNWKDSLWTCIYIHARRADLDRAQQAFAEVQRELADLGEKPDLKCWNTLLNAHAKADDLVGGLTNLQNLIETARLTPDAHSFHPLTEMFAKRGDVDGVEDMLEQYDHFTQAPRNTALIGSLITAFVQSQNVETAEKVLQDTIERTKTYEVIGSLTKCFNLVLTAHAVRRDLESTRRVYHMMRDRKTRLDAASFGALIFALSVRRQMNWAYSILQTAMRDVGVEPAAFHYGVIMAGYNNAGMAEEALQVHTHMVRKNIKPSAATRTAFLRARANLEQQKSGRSSRGEVDQHELLETTLQDFRRLVDLPEDGAADQPPAQDRQGSKSEAELVGIEDASETELAAHFDLLIFMHGKQRSLWTCRQLLRQYQEMATEGGADPDALPIRLQASLMSALWRAGEYEEVETVWKLAKERADTVAPTVPAPRFDNTKESVQVHRGQQVPDALELTPTTEPAADESTNETAADNMTDPPTSSPTTTVLPSNTPRTLPHPSSARRHILTRPLRYYLAALHALSRPQDMIHTVSSLLNQGYVLDNRTFNFFIECLCRTAPPLALLAFTLTERFLIPSFPGWRNNPGPTRPSERAEGLQHLRARYLRPGQLMPQYRVLVRLGSVLLDVRRLEAMGRRGASGGKEGEMLERYVGTLAEIRRRAPKTLFAVQSMPYRPDKLQSRLLRREG